MRSTSDSSYYGANHRMMIREFNAMQTGTRRTLRAHLSEDEIDRLREESVKEYTNLWASLPFVGGRKSSSTINMVMGAIALSIIRPLQRKGLAAAQIGQVLFDAFDGYFQAKPRLIQHMLGKVATSRFFRKRIQMQIEKSQERRYSGDFVIEFVRADGKDFDFGYDYTECRCKHSSCNMVQRSTCGMSAWVITACSDR